MCYHREKSPVDCLLSYSQVEWRLVKLMFKDKCCAGMELLCSQNGTEVIAFLICMDIIASERC